MLGWPLLLTVAGLVVAGLSAYAIQSARIDERLDASLAQEVAEFRELAQGPDPSTDAPWASLRELMYEALRRQVPDDNETLLAVIDGDVALVPSARPPVELENDPDAVSELGRTFNAMLDRLEEASPPNAGSSTTPATSCAHPRRSCAGTWS